MSDLTPNESLIAPEVRLRRLRYRSWHRGCKETDVILGHFADLHLDLLQDDQITIYERLLEEQDADIWNWLVEKEAPSDPGYEPLLALLRAHSGRG